MATSPDPAYTDQQSVRRFGGFELDLRTGALCGRATNHRLQGQPPSDLTQNLAEGYLVNPPDQRSNTQRVFVPRSALESLVVLAVIGATRRPRRSPTEDQRQVPMFEE